MITAQSDAGPHAPRAQQRPVPTVLLDAGPAVHQRAGLSRYAHELARHLDRLAPHDMRLALFYNRHSHHALPDSLAHMATVSLPLSQARWRLGALAGQVLRITWPPIERQAAQQLGSVPSLYHATEHLLPRMAATSVLTVHDLIFEWLPAFHTRLNRIFLRLAMPRFLNAAHAIIAVSAHTAHDIVARYHVETKRIHVIHEGVDERFRPATPLTIAKVRADYELDAPYLLMVGTLEPRKNHVLAIRALKRLRHAGYPHRLVIAGGHGWLFESVQAVVSELGIEDAVRFTGYVPMEDLAALYSGADCFLLPSLYEGFGFPVLEAMACGTPVVCSNVSSLPEIAGDAALLVSPHDDLELAAAVERILSEPELAGTLRRRGLARAARFRWADCAAATLAVYRELLAAGTRHA